MTRYEPPVGFHFQVEILGLSPDANDLRFTEVGGLSVETATEEVPEGGENRFTQKYPTRLKYPDLVLKRGLYVGSKALDWIRTCLAGDVVEPKDANVILLNQERKPLFTWHMKNAFPTKWAVADLNASGNAVVIETLQMYYQFFTVNRS